MIKNLHRNFLIGFTLILLWQVVPAQTDARFYTSFGEFDVTLRDDLVPITAGNFISLADTQFYDGIIWHRVVKNFVNQSGDPTGTGSGGPGYTIPDEFHQQLRHYKRGILSMANSGPNTGGSQFFITMKQVLYLDSLHAVFGEVINGMAVIDSIEDVAVDGNDRPLSPVFIDSIRVLVPASRMSELNSDLILGSVAPNPFSGELTVFLGLRKSRSVTVELLDAYGRRVFHHDALNLAPGDHQISLDVGELASGIYFCRISDGVTVVSRKVVRE